MPTEEYWLLFTGAWCGVWWIVGFFSLRREIGKNHESGEGFYDNRQNAVVALWLLSPVLAPGITLLEVMALFGRAAKKLLRLKPEVKDAN